MCPVKEWSIFTWSAAPPVCARVVKEGGRRDFLGGKRGEMLHQPLAQGRDCESRDLAPRRSFQSTPVLGHVPPIDRYDWLQPGLVARWLDKARLSDNRLANRGVNKAGRAWKRAGRPEREALDAAAAAFWWNSFCICSNSLFSLFISPIYYLKKKKS